MTRWYSQTIIFICICIYILWFFFNWSPGCIKLTRNFLFIHQQFKIYSFAYGSTNRNIISLLNNRNWSRARRRIYEKSNICLGAVTWFLPVLPSIILVYSVKQEKKKYMRKGERHTLIYIFIWAPLEYPPVLHFAFSFSFFLL